MNICLLRSHRHFRQFTLIPRSVASFDLGQVKHLSECVAGSSQQDKLNKQRHGGVRPDSCARPCPSRLCRGCGAARRRQRPRGTAGELSAAGRPGGIPDELALKSVERGRSVYNPCNLGQCEQARL